jgi:hypothetical protein
MDTNLFKTRDQLHRVVGLLNDSKPENIGRAKAVLSLLIKDINYQQKEFEYYLKKEMENENE